MALFPVKFYPLIQEALNCVHRSFPGPSLFIVPRATGTTPEVNMRCLLWPLECVFSILTAVQVVDFVFSHVNPLTCVNTLPPPCLSPSLSASSSPYPYDRRREEVQLFGNEPNCALQFI